MPKYKLAVIGGGTGFVALWALSASKEVDGWLFEAKEKLGGNVQSPVILKIPREVGAEFIGPKSEDQKPGDFDRSYRDTHRLFDQLKVKRMPFPLTMGFHNLKTNEFLALPPVEPYYSQEEDCLSSCLSCFGLFKKTEVATNLHISHSALWKHFLDLVNLETMIHEAKDIEAFYESGQGNNPSQRLCLATQKLLPSNEVLTLEELAEHFIQAVPIDEVIKQRQAFVNDLLYPLIAAEWGLHKVAEVKNFCAHYAMHYLETKGKSKYGAPIWYHVPEGIQSYFDKMQADLSPRTKVKTNCPIVGIVPVEVEGETKYKLRLEDRSFVCDEKGEVVLFSDLIIATPPYITQKLIEGIQDEETQALCEKLAKVEFYKTIIVHREVPDGEFKDKTIANTSYNPETDQAFNTVVKYFNDNLGKSWWPPETPLPDDCLHTAEFFHPVMNRSYYEAEQAIHALQGKKGIFYGGTIAGTNDSHESGVRASLLNAAKCLLRHDLNPQDNPRLQHFPETLRSVRDPQQPLSSEKQGIKAPAWQFVESLEEVDDSDIDFNYKLFQ